ncbi:SDR family NAD(P)-dependent oxidoreductase [Amorphus coralli]|uniref:SDR family NAD(P)-dependent oxidoreductase n=1 Tax=Amorphus coralli TaxID=340680 RepID=UPI000362CF8B|nr:SDR family NAD(P)-dependent oxidoreductase [Amorphus coralli]
MTVTALPGAGRRVYVIGASRGIGAAIAQAAAEDGYDVTLTSREPQGPVAEVAAELSAAHPGRDFVVHQADTGDRASVAALAALIEEDEATYGLVYNAGQSYDRLAASIEADRAAELMEINALGFMRLASAAMRPMVRARAGRIVATGSITASYGVSGNATYAATKGALLGYVRTLAVEIARKGVTVNYIAPGFVETKLIEPYLPYREKMERQIPAGRLAQPEEIAHLVRFVLSPLAGYMTGSVLTIDGGLSANLINRRP